MHLAIVAVAASTGVALAANVASTGSYVVPNPGEVVTVSVMIDAVIPLAGANVTLVVGDGGIINGGSDTAPPAPEILTSDIVTGTIFNGSNTGNNPLVIGPLLHSNTTSTASGSVVGQALLCNFTLQTHEAGVWGIYLDPAYTQIGPDLPGPADLIGGTITVLPEPATVLLLLATLPLFRRSGS
jgi:hypothetical protein